MGLKQVKEMLLSTDYPQWRNLLSTAAFLIMTTGTAAAWIYIYYTSPDAACHRGFLYLTYVWLFIQWVVIGYLYQSKDIPSFARDAIKVLILLSNVWFGLFLFSLQPCAQ